MTNLGGWGTEIGKRRRNGKNGEGKMKHIRKRVHFVCHLKLALFDNSLHILEEQQLSSRCVRLQLLILLDSLG